MCGGLRDCGIRRCCVRIYGFSSSSSLLFFYPVVLVLGLFGTSEQVDLTAGIMSPLLSRRLLQLTPLLF